MSHAPMNCGARHLGRFGKQPNRVVTDHNVQIKDPPRDAIRLAGRITTPRRTKKGAKDKNKNNNKHNAWKQHMTSWPWVNPNELRLMPPGGIRKTKEMNNNRPQHPNKRPTARRNSLGRARNQPSTHTKWNDKDKEQQPQRTQGAI